MTPGEGGGEQPPQIITPDQANTRLPQPGESLVIANKSGVVTGEVPVGPQQEVVQSDTGDSSSEDTETIIPGEGEQIGDESQPPKTREELDNDDEEKRLKDIKNLSLEERDKIIEKLIMELDDSIKNSTNLVQLRDEFKQSLKENGATDTRIKAEMSRLDDQIDRLRDLAEANVDDEFAKNNITAEQAEEKKSQIRKFMESGLVSLGEFVKEGLETSSLPTFLELFLVFGTKGNDTPLGRFSREVEKDSSDAYLMKELEKGGEEGLKSFIELFLGKIDVGPLGDENLKKLFRDMSERINIDDNWKYINDGLSLFLNNRDYSGDHKFNKDNIKIMIETLDGKSADQIRKTFGISTLETSKGSEDPSDGSDQTTTSGGSQPTQPASPADQKA